MANRISVTNNLARVHAIGELCVLRPGANLVDADKWAEAKKIAIVRHHLEAGDLTEGEGEIESETPGNEIPTDALSKLSNRKAAELVAATLDLRVLRAWAAAEVRATVKRAIAIQIETVDAAAKEDEKDGE